MASSTKVDIEVDSQADSWFAKLGPGLITGAADDDPSGIATYSQAGAQFGFNMLWTVLLTYPLMVAIQVVSARIGRVSGHGLATNLRRHYPRWLLYGTVVLLLGANTINIAADLTAMGAAVNLLIGGPPRTHTRSDWVCFRSRCRCSCRTAGMSACSSGSPWHCSPTSA